MSIHFLIKLTEQKHPSFNLQNIHPNHHKYDLNF